MLVSFQSRREQAGHRIAQYGCRDGSRVCGATLVHVPHMDRSHWSWTLIICAAPESPIDEATIQTIKRRLLPHVPMRSQTPEVVTTLANGCHVATLVEADDMPYRDN